MDLVNLRQISVTAEEYCVCMDARMGHFTDGEADAGAMTAGSDAGSQAVSCVCPYADTDAERHTHLNASKAAIHMDVLRMACSMSWADFTGVMF